MLYFLFIQVSLYFSCQAAILAGFRGETLTGGFMTYSLTGWISPVKGKEIETKPCRRQGLQIARCSNDEKQENVGLKKETAVIKAVSFFKSI